MAQANTGEFGRALIESDVLTTVVWGVVLAPIAEELKIGRASCRERV